MLISETYARAEGSIDTPTEVREGSEEEDTGYSGGAAGDGLSRLGKERVSVRTLETLERRAGEAALCGAQVFNPAGGPGRACSDREGS